MSEKEFDCIGIGLSPYDFTMLVESHPKPDSKHVALEMYQGGGGPVPNVIIALAKFGCNTALITTMGDDYFGRSVYQEFEKFNVDVSGFKLDPDFESLHAHITVDQSDGRRAIILSTNDLPKILMAQVPENNLERTKLITLDSRISPEIIDMVKVAKDAGAKIMLDAGSVQPHLEELLPLLDYPIVSYPFVQQYFGHTNVLLAAKTLVESGATIAGVTMGNRGSVLANETEALEIPAFQVEAIDTTGAGDLYHAGVLFGILQGWDLKPTGQFASAVSALGCLSLGARSRIPDLWEVRQFLHQNDITNHPLFALMEDKNE